jgi:hypothetical protein
MTGECVEALTGFLVYGTCARVYENQHLSYTDRRAVVFRHGETFFTKAATAGQERHSLLGFISVFSKVVHV